MIYRLLVAAQTLGWALLSFTRIVGRNARSSPSAHGPHIALALGPILGIAAGLLIYYFRRPQWHARDAAVLAWGWFQVAGLLALTGYAVAGTPMYFIVGIATLAVMHAFSPNRFQTRLGA